MTFASLFGLGDTAFSNPNCSCADALVETLARTTVANHKTEIFACLDTFPTLFAIIPDDDPASIENS